ncbi:MAG: L-threonylcarbamoyladenylate synthase [Flavobacteriales bacterium]
MSVATLLAVHPKDPEPRKIKEIVAVLNGGGVVVVPTDAVYAFVCSAHQPRAIDKVAALKGVRPEKAELSLICRDLSQAATYARQMDTGVFRMMKRALPGPYTFILPATSEVPNIFKQKRRTVGIRIPSNAILQHVLEELGHPLVAASVHGTDPFITHPSDAGTIEDLFAAKVDLIVDGGPGDVVGSTIIDATGPEPRLVREGLGSLDGIL